MRRAPDGIATRVRERDAIRPHVWREITPSRGPARSAHLEDVHVVGGKVRRQHHRGVTTAVVRDDDLLVQHTVPEKLLESQVDGGQGQADPVAGDQIRIRQRDREEIVAGGHRGVEIERTAALELDGEPGEESGAFVIEALFAESTRAYVTVLIEYAEGLRVVQHARVAPRGERSGHQMRRP